MLIRRDARDADVDFFCVGIQYRKKGRLQKKEGVLLLSFADTGFCWSTALRFVLDTAFIYLCWAHLHPCAAAEREDIARFLVLFFNPSKTTNQSSPKKPSTTSNRRTPKRKSRRQQRSVVCWSITITWIYEALGIALGRECFLMLCTSALLSDKTWVQIARKVFWGIKVWINVLEDGIKICKSIIVHQKGKRDISTWTSINDKIKLNQSNVQLQREAFQKILDKCHTWR